MNQIIDVEYRVVDTIEEKTDSELIEEVNFYWNQMELIGRLGIEYAARAGKRLNVLKGRVRHGEWENWCRDNLCFSKSKAEKMMKLAVKMEDENSPIFKSVNFTDIGISKVYALLSAPEEIQKEVISDPTFEEKTVKDLKKQIMDLKNRVDEKTEELEKATEELRDAKNAKEDLDSLVDEMEKEINRLNSVETDEEALHEAQREVEDLKQKLEDEKEKLKKAKDKFMSEKERMKIESDNALDLAKEEAKKAALQENEDKVERLKAEYNRAKSEIESLQKKLANSSNETLTEFKLMSKQLQEDFNSCLAKLNSFDEEMQSKLRNALKQILSVMGGKL